MGVKHKFVSAKSDDADTTLIRPSNWNDDHQLVASSTDNAIVRFDGTDGTAVQNSGVTIDDDDNLTFAAGYVETIEALSGTAPAFSIDNGTVKTWTLTGNSTPTDSLAAGESIIVMVDDGSAYTITWPSVTWTNNGGAAPTLTTTGYTVVSLWKVSSTLYGALVGDGT